PGLANGLANLHNARRAGTPILNIVGDHATQHLQYDAPLTSDIQGLAKPMSDWVRRSATAEEFKLDLEEAIRTTSIEGGKVCTLILPADVAGMPNSNAPRVLEDRTSTFATASPAQIKQSAAVIRSQQSVLLLLGGRALRQESLDIAARITSHHNVDILAETSNARMERGEGRPAIDRLPYSVDGAVNKLKKYDAIILVEAKDPVAFFAYPDKPSIL